MWLFQIFRSYLGWAISIGRRIIRQAAPQVAVVVLATIVSQLSRLLAFFLPLKIIILIGSDRVPRYFPSFFADFEREPLVLWLAAATIGFYVLYLLADKVADIFAERAADRVSAHTGKLSLFNDQDETLRDACRRLAASFAAVIFAVLALGLLAYIYPVVAVVIVGWLAMAILAVAIVGSLGVRVRDWLDDHVRAVVDGIGAVGLYAVTGAIIYDFISGAHFPILFAIISLLLTRTLLQQLGRVFKHAKVLHPRRMSVTPLVLRSHAWTGERKTRREDVWTMLQRGAPGSWMIPVIAEVTGEPVADLEVRRWHETGVSDLFVFDVTARTASGEARDYFVKLFGGRLAVAGRREASLFESAPALRLPAPPFLGAASLDEHTCNVFASSAGSPVGRREAGEVALDLVARCWSCVPPRELALRYGRSHQTLWRRLASADLDRLAMVARDPEESTTVAAFVADLERICGLVEDLPLVVYNRDIRAPHLYRPDEGSAMALHWGRWRLEPVGAGWPSDELGKLPLWLARAAESRPELAGVGPGLAELAAVLVELDELLARERYRSAVALLPALMACAAASAGPDGAISAKATVARLAPAARNPRPAKAERRAKAAEAEAAGPPARRPPRGVALKRRREQRELRRARLGGAGED